ncbi:type VI secretion system-associated protein TagO [Roseovarius sp. 217]|uniref:type VI secretion system-associated protein TagO n=1 Tax=Roseovarius sp. (strain 217) TaxID=314264 RepID=UPI001C2F7849|nr:type VI secretion system-associated protein TagO [Roseovarius sp. 217]
MSMVPVLFATMINIGSGALASEDEAKSCHAVVNTLERLGCYDRATGYVVPDSATNSGEPLNDADFAKPEVPLEKSEGQWTVTMEKSPIDDSENVYISLVSEDDITARFGSAGPMRIFIQCRENTTLFYVTFNDHFMSDHQHGKVTYRLDKNPAGDKNMKESTDHMALGLWSGGTSIPFIKQMFGHDKLLIRATPHSESPVTATFAISGVENAIEPLRENCNW